MQVMWDTNAINKVRSTDPDGWQQDGILAGIETYRFLIHEY